jgi:hypothetical protein
MTQTYLAKDRFHHAIQALEPNVTQNIGFTTAASSATAADFNGNTVVVRLLATADCYVALGPAATVSASTGSMYIPAYTPEYFRVEEGSTWRAAARGVVAAGTLNITEMT